MHKKLTCLVGGSYEPPFFVAADTKQDLHFGTKDATQIPDKTSIGHIETGFHS
jgi:hypothetical protein